MKRIVSILSLMILAVVFPARSGDPEGPGGPMGGGERRMRMHDEMGLGGPGGPGGHFRALPFEQHLFPPELVLTHQAAIGLTTEQVVSIKKMLSETHTRMLDSHVDLQRMVERMSLALEPARVDEGAALAAAEEAMALESQVKKTHLALLIRIKNMLTETQQAKLRELRGSEREED